MVLIESRPHPPPLPVHPGPAVHKPTGSQQPPPADHWLPLTAPTPCQTHPTLLHPIPTSSPPSASNGSNFLLRKCSLLFTLQKRGFPCTHRDLYRNIPHSTVCKVKQLEISHLSSGSGMVKQTVMHLLQNIMQPLNRSGSTCAKGDEFIIFITRDFEFFDTANAISTSPVFPN